VYASQRIPASTYPPPPPHLAYHLTLSVASYRIIAPARLTLYASLHPTRLTLRIASSHPPPTPPRTSRLTLARLAFRLASATRLGPRLFPSTQPRLSRLASSLPSPRLRPSHLARPMFTLASLRITLLLASQHPPSRLATHSTSPRSIFHPVPPHASPRLTSALPPLHFTSNSVRLSVSHRPPSCLASFFTYL
jgi:hypothetical protein